MDIRAQLEDRLMAYVEDTLNYIETVRDFCDQEQKWTSERREGLNKMRDINENQQEGNLGAVLTDTLTGLEKLEPFLDAVEKLTVTSQHVFCGQIFLLRGKSPESVHSADIDTCETGQPLVQLILNKSENDMKQMLHHLNQLIEIRMDEHTRLAFLFQEDAQKFTDVFGECRSRMWQLLSDLEDTAVHLDSMKKGASISTVTGSSVGIVGGVLSIAGIILAFFTAGASLGLTVAGAGLGGISAANGLVTGITEMAVNSHHEHKAQSYLKSYKDDMIKIEDCLKEVANRERPLVQPSGVDVKTILTGLGEGFKETLNGMGVAEAYKLYKSEKASKALTEIELKELSTAREVPQVAKYLSGTEKLAKASTLAVTKCTRVASGLVNAFFIGLDGYFIYEASESLAQGSETEVSKLIRSRAVLWKSELEAWEKMYDSLRIGKETISKSKITLEKQFVP
ncbi:apolipo L4-like protein [Labeo rohita]|uniref:Apolipo L4-like protein n=1 Tax=Labeo rohita TaxID=84645 RepID=A0A498LSL4_LABRO|nr:apolipo L4-like protein [Labeo rohita]